MELLSLINTDVNQSIQYQADKADIWQAPCATKGDCEDYAICKASKLAERGVSLDRMQILVCLRPNVGMHAVLVVDGKQVLDNMPRYKAVYPIEQANCLPIFTCDMQGTMRVNGKVITKGQGYAAKCKAAAESITK